MPKKPLVNQVLFGRSQILLWLCLFLAALVTLNTFFGKPQISEAATSSTINFQARLLTSSGAVVPDGYYNVQFKLYNTSSGGSALWTETYYDSNGATAGNDNRVRVVNGYLTVNLNALNNNWGSVADWSEEMWLTMNIGGRDQDDTPAWDGEMSPRLKLTAVPYAFEAANADRLGGVAASDYARLDQNQTFTGHNVFQPASGSTTAFQLQNAGGQTIFNFDSSNNRIGIGTNNTSPTYGLDVTTTVGISIGSQSALVVKDSIYSSRYGFLVDTVNYGIYSNYDVTIENSENSETAFQVQDANAANTLFRVDADNNRVVIGDGDDSDDANTTLLVVDSASTANLPIGVNGGIIYDETDNKFKIYENGEWKTLCNETDAADCGGGSSVSDMQTAYDGGSVVLAQEGQSIQFYMGGGFADTNFQIDLAGAANRFLITDEANEKELLSINSEGQMTLQGSSTIQGDSTTALQVQDGNGDSLLTVDTTNSKVEVVGDIYSKGLQWTERGTGVSERLWYSVTYGNGMFVALAYTGSGDSVITSPDGINWTSHPTANDGAYWMSVTYGNGLFVAVSLLGDVMTSPDGINWTARTGTVGFWSSVTYGNGTFVAVSSSGGSVMTSPDGINWTARTAATTNGWTSVIYGNGQFVAVASSGTGDRVMTSPDGINWTAQDSAADETWNSVTYGNGMFVAVGSGSNGVMTSPDGINWTARTESANNTWNSVTYGNGLFVAVAYNASGNGVMTSPDGINWTTRKSASENSWRAVTYGNGMFVAVSTDDTAGEQVMTSGKMEVNIVPHNNIYQGGMTVNGDAKFKSGENSTTAFQIQNASGDSLFNVDSTNFNISLNGGYNGMLQSWQTGNNTGFSSRDSYGSVIANGHVYIIGGNSGGTTYGTVQYAKILANGDVGDWTTTAPLPGSAVRARSSAAYANGYIYVTGGSSGNSNATATDTVFYAKVNQDGTISEWKTGTAINVSGSQKLWSHTAAAYNGYLYIMGGIDDSATTRQTVYYSKLNADGSNGPWAAANSLDTFTAHHSSLVANGYLYSIGDDNSATIQYAKLNADGTLGSWATTTSLPATRMFMSVGVANGYIYAAGGSNGSGTYYDSTYYAPLNADGTIGTWNCQGTSGNCSGATHINTTALPATRSGAGNTNMMYNGYMYVVGGWNGSVQSTVYYASTARIQVHGSLDLVGNSGANLAEGGTGGSLTAGNTNIVGTFDVRGTATFGQGMSVGGALSVNDRTHIALNSSDINNMPLLIEQKGSGDSGIEIKNNAQSYYVGLDASDGNKFKISSSTAGGGQGIMGNDTVSGTPDSGATNVVGFMKVTAPISGTVSTLKAYLQGSGTSNNKAQVAIYADSSGSPTGSALAISNELTVASGSAWYTFTLASPINVTATTTYWLAYTSNGENNVYYYLSTHGDSAYKAATYSTGSFTTGSGSTLTGAQRIMYAVVDAPGASSDNLNTSLFEMGVNGDAIFRNSENSTAAFQIQNAAGSNIITADSTNTRVLIGSANAPNLSGAQLAVTVAEVQTTLRVGDATNGFSFNDSATGASGKFRLYGTARNTKKLVLTPEYAGAVLDGSGTGTMTAAYDGTARKNYYKWTTSQGTTQSYDIVITMSVPSDWSAWAASNAISVDGWTSNTSNSTGSLTVVSTDGTTDVNAVSITPGSTSTWTTTSTNLTSSSIYTADGTMVIRLSLTAQSSSSFQLGNITLTYLSQF